MKLYIKSSKYAYQTAWRGYCTYTASNDTWGYDSYRFLRKSGGERGYVKFPNLNGSGYYRPMLIYMFPDKKSYESFRSSLEDSNLSWHIKIGPYRDLTEGTIILQEGY